MASHLSITSEYDEHVVDAGRQPELLVLVAFLVTFVVVRIITHAIRRGARVPGVRDRSVGGRHLHHLVFGIIALLVAGYCAIAFDDPWRSLLAVVYGIGAALTLDEFALWLDLEDVYWTPEGRLSIDAVVVFASLAGIIALLAPFLVDIADDL
jgi:hypothetical protein